jgi:F-type H+-transporting ATPase subunit b
MQIITNIALISINETLIVQLLSFLIFLFIINRVMIRPLRSVMAERERHIDNIKEDIVTAEKNLVEKTRQSQKKENLLRAEALRFESEMEAAGQAQAATIVEQAKTEIVRLKKAADDEIADQLKVARLKIQARSETLARHIMEKVLERSLTP